MNDELTARDVAVQIARYRNDFRTFAKEQLRLGSKEVEFWPCQIPLIESIEKQFKEKGFARCIWLKARQVGASTLAQCFVAWRAMLWPNVNAIVIADEAERAKTLFDISKSFYEQMDEHIRPQGRYITKREIVFANPSHASRTADPGLRSRIVIDSAQKRNLAIGANWQIAHLSECARFPHPDFVIDGLLPAVHRIPGTLIIMESSAEQAGTWYREFFEASMRGQTGFDAKFVPWHLQPEYQIPLAPGEKLELEGDEVAMITQHGLTNAHIKWFREKLAEMGNDLNLFKQNYPLTPDECWITPGAQVFPSKNLQEMRINVMSPKRRCEVFPGPRVLDAPNGRLLIWEEPEPNKSYDFGVDCASGLGKDDDEDTDYLDNSVICILKRGSNEQVAEFCSKAIDPFEFATLLYWLGAYYNNGQIAVETNSIGGATNSQLAKLGYPNCYLWRYRDEAVPRYTRKTGWETSPRSKPWLVGFAIHEIVNRRVLVRSELLLREMEMFVQKGPREWGAVAGTKDDRVMALMIALLVSDDENFEKYFGLVKTTDAQKLGGESKLLPEPWEADLTFRRRKPDFDHSPWT